MYDIIKLQVCFSVAIIGNKNNNIKAQYYIAIIQLKQTRTEKKFKRNNI